MAKKKKAPEVAVKKTLTEIRNDEVIAHREAADLVNANLVFCVLPVAIYRKSISDDGVGYLVDIRWKPGVSLHQMLRNTEGDVFEFSNPFVPQVAWDCRLSCPLSEIADERKILRLAKYGLPVTSGTCHQLVQWLGTYVHSNWQRLLDAAERRKEKKDERQSKNRRASE